MHVWILAHFYVKQPDTDLTTHVQVCRLVEGAKAEVYTVAMGWLLVREKAHILVGDLNAHAWILASQAT
jgi:hypothetical protein